jgi:hypothetical protein
MAKKLMTLLHTVTILILLSGCQQKKINPNGRCKKIAMRTFISDGITNWYYIRINEPGEKGYYLASGQPVSDFSNANFIYYNMRPIEFRGQYLSKEKIILVNAKDLPKNIQQSMAELESISINVEISDK